MSKPLREILNEGFFRNTKRQIGHSLPNRVRGILVAAPVAGKYIQAKMDGDERQAKNYKEGIKKTLSGRTIPKFKDS